MSVEISNGQVYEKVILLIDSNMCADYEPVIFSSTFIFIVEESLIINAEKYILRTVYLYFTSVDLLAKLLVNKYFKEETVDYRAI